MTVRNRGGRRKAPRVSPPAGAGCDAVRRRVRAPACGPGVRPAVRRARGYRSLSDGDGEAEEVWAAFREAALVNLRGAFAAADAGSMAALADELCGRDRVFVGGTQTSHHLARYFHAVVGMASPSYRLAGREGGISLDELVDMGKRDALVCVASAPSDLGAVGAVRLARDRGALVVVLSGGGSAELAALSDRLLLLPGESPGYCHSSLGTLAVLEALSGFVVEREGSAARRRIARIEADRRRFETLLAGEAGRE